MSQSLFNAGRVAQMCGYRKPSDGPRFPHLIGEDRRDGVLTVS